MITGFLTLTDCFYFHKYEEWETIQNPGGGGRIAANAEYYTYNILSIWHYVWGLRVKPQSHEGLRPCRDLCTRAVQIWMQVAS